MAIPNPGFSVRFFIRPRHKVGTPTDTLTPLRLKVWIGATKRYLYLSTNAEITPNQFKAFASDGTPSKVADPELTRIVDLYRMATHYVVSGAIVNNQIDNLTSALLQSRVEGVITRIKANQKTKHWQKIIPFASPNHIGVCRGCIFASTECRAPWIYQREADQAAEYAVYNGLCQNRCVKTDRGYMFQPNPNYEPKPFVVGLNDRLIEAVKEYADKQGKEGENEQ